MRELHRIVVADRAVLDPAHDGDTSAQGLDATFDGVEVVFGENRFHDELEHRGAAGHEVAHRAVARLLPQLARVHALGGDRDVGLRGGLLVALERLHRRRATGVVAVEGVDDLTAEEAVVHEQATQQREMFVTEGRAARGDRGLHAGQMHGHDVGVALDDHGLVRLGDLALGEIETEQHLRFLVQHRFRCVHVLGGDLVVVVQTAGTEADDVAREIADGPQQPPVETVDRAAPSLPGQSRGLEFGEVEAPAEEVLGERVPAGGCVAAAERLGGRLVEVALGQVVAGGLGVGRAQLLGIELLSGRVRRDQPGTRARSRWTDGPPPS